MRQLIDTQLFVWYLLYGGVMKKVVFIFLLFFNISFVYASSKFNVTLDKCIDGDTARFVIKDEVKTVRFLSINTPEITHDDVLGEPFGEEASIFTCNMLTNASSIKLQYDSKSDKEDKYGRVLAWVFVDNDLLQEKLVSEGLAEVKYVYNDYKYSAHLKEVEEDAKNKELGIWATTHVFNKTDNNYDNYEFYLVILCIFIIGSACLRWIYIHILKK